MSEQQKIYFVVFVHFYFSICKILKRAKRVIKKNRSICIKFTPKSRFRIYIYYTRNVPGEDLTTKLQLCLDENVKLRIYIWFRDVLVMFSL